MAYVPYGYTITDGVVTVDERAADQVRDFFEKYISGLSLAVAGEQAGIQKTHSSMGLILKTSTISVMTYTPQSLLKRRLIRPKKLEKKCEGPRADCRACSF